ncbi:mandelate racemase muconate lactonizing protein [Moniliophthora roreri MCA 2997]|uniref:Mandelate racemase muconate lactonizing protein n=1 Tax=Moniliophthora roreri (strain MCA 2997) TaxID=1381753 RepID=V2WXX3_MONRO|nr:mandelate racemase muconate lactonizing protein [Moniliophthora roreri MCA 2997]
MVNVNQVNKLLTTSGMEKNKHHQQHQLTFSVMLLKQLLLGKAEAIVCQINACHFAGSSEVISMLLIVVKFCVSVCLHAGGIGHHKCVTHLRYVAPSL